MSDTSATIPVSQSKDTIDIQDKDDVTFIGKQEVVRSRSTDTNTPRADNANGKSDGDTKRGKSSMRLRFSKSLSFDQDSSRRKSIPNRLRSVLVHMVGRKGHGTDTVQTDANSDSQASPTTRTETKASSVRNDPTVCTSLSDQDKRILREGWNELKDDISLVGVETFMGFFSTHPDAIESFLAFKDYNMHDIEQSAILKAHALRVMQTVDKCVSRLDAPDKMAAVLTTLGSRHIGYRAKPSFIPIIGKQFIAAIEPKLGDRWSEESKSAWERLFDIINHYIREGMTGETSDSH